MIAHHWNGITVTRSSDQVSCELPGESTILHLPSGTYYGLGDVGQRVWTLLETPRQGAELTTCIAMEYAVEPSHCELDIHELLEDLLAHHLIMITDRPAATTAIPPA